MLTGKSAAVLFSFKRVYNILCLVKQVLGQLLLIFLVNSLESLAARSEVSFHWLDCWRGPILEFWKAGTTAENATNNKMYGVLVTNIREHRV